jgi:ADP-ribose pyrophosphatase YjhB (NUDIX family)
VASSFASAARIRAQDASPCLHHPSGATRHSSGHRHRPSAVHSATVSSSGGAHPLLVSNQRCALRTAISASTATVSRSWEQRQGVRHYVRGACARCRRRKAGRIGHGILYAWRSSGDVPGYLVCRDPADRVLLTRFASAGHPDHGKWTTPGGAMEWGESQHETAARELEEETGLCATLGPVLGVFSRWYTDQESVRGEAGHVVGIVYEATNVTGQLRNLLRRGNHGRCWVVRARRGHRPSACRVARLRPQPSLKVTFSRLARTLPFQSRWRRGRAVCDSDRLDSTCVR